MPEAPIAVPRKLPALLYLGAAFVLIDQATIVLATAFPAVLESPQWRFGAVGLTAGRFSPLLLADLMLVSAAMLAGHLRALRVLGAIHLVLSLLLLGLTANFALDAIQVRRTLPVRSQQSMVPAAIRAAMLLLVLAIGTAWIGVRAWGAGKWTVASERGARPLVVGSDREGA